ncbi:hypothetical protein IFM89_039190 [Coptis chinensis]|uniref:Pre-mRNA-splicing factor Syf1/CRNKL1-like C-terminal HAT-repeats domain-containing protein n=1 Tax=Coptis chinensis TaxID=261450 RepID=A0A835LH42_9MAGN|nr:hypothetical protein IFM89_039190 [Coptis chinensis]
MDEVVTGKPVISGISTPAENLKVLYLQYAKLEEDYGLAKRAMKVYDQAAKTVPDNEKMSMYEIYIACAAEIFGVPKTREIYEQAIESGLPDKDVKVMCMKYAELEKSLGEIDRARAIYNFSSQYADPRSDANFWTKWHDFEVQHGNKDIFREMLRMKRSVSTSYSQRRGIIDSISSHILFSEYPMQKDRKLNLKKLWTLCRLWVPGEMAALERQFAPNPITQRSKDGGRKLGDGGTMTKLKLRTKMFPLRCLANLVNKVEENNKDGDEETYSKLGALERIKRRDRIYVGGLDPSVSLEDLKVTFSQDGETTSVRIRVGKDLGLSNLPTVWGIISNDEEALLKLHTTDVNTLGLGVVDSQNKI